MTPPASRLLRPVFHRWFAAFVSLTSGSLLAQAGVPAPFPAAPAVPLGAHELTAWHDATRVLVNPHKGWYHHFPDNHPDKYRVARDADLLEFPGMDHIYLRLAWA